MDELAAILRASLLAQLRDRERHRDPLRLTGHGAKYFSQGDEDGILAEIFRRIGERHRFFVEIGCGDGSENNSVHLLLQGWRGIWIEASREHATVAARRYAPFVAAGKLRIVNATIDPANVDALLVDNGAPGEIDLFSLDIDGNDHHVFRALSCVRPRVAVLEYNAAMGPVARWAMPYDAKHRWDESLVFGASLAGLDEVARGKGLSLVGCNLPGTNGFWVAESEDLSGFRGPFTPVEHFEPPRYYLLPMYGGHRLPGPEDDRLARGVLD